MKEELIVLEKANELGEYILLIYDSVKARLQTVLKFEDFCFTNAESDARYYRKSLQGELCESIVYE